MTFNPIVMADRDGNIYGVKVYPHPGTGCTLIQKAQYGVMCAVEASTSHATNGSRGRAFKYLTRDQMEEAFTVLVLRAMAAPMNEALLFADIPGMPTD